MPRYIDADLLKAEFTGNFTKAHATPLIKAIIDEQPTADVQEVRHGRWKEDEETGCLMCSECGHLTDEILGDFIKTDYGLIHCSLRPTYCSKCGAKMDGGESDEP